MSIRACRTQYHINLQEKIGIDKYKGIYIYTKYMCCLYILSHNLLIQPFKNYLYYLPKILAGKQLSDEIMYSCVVVTLGGNKRNAELCFWSSQHLAIIEKKGFLCCCCYTGKIYQKFWKKNEYFLCVLLAAYNTKVALKYKKHAIVNLKVWRNRQHAMSW